MNIDTFIRRHQITASVKEIDRRADRHMDDMPYGTRHFRFNLKCGARRFTFPYSQGPGIANEPTTADALNAVALDAACVANGQSFEDFCLDLGFDTDSRRAEQTYRACLRTAASLERLLGTRDYETLLWSVERQ